MLFKESLSQLLRHAHGLGMFTSIITNGSFLRREWMAENAPYLGMLGLSCDSASDIVNFLHGRWPKGACEPHDTPAGRRSLAERHVLRAAALAHEHGVEFKINTVVTVLNQAEDLTPLINEARPSRWKVFQVLAVDAENAGTGALNDVGPLLVSRDQFDAFIARNSHGLDDPRILKSEPNDIMQSSYVLLDERARFLDPSTGGKVPTQVGEGPTPPGRKGAN